MKRFAVITGLLAGFLFGIATPLSKLLLTELNSFQLAGLLYLGAGAAMFPFILKKNNQIKVLFNGKNISKTIGIIFFGGFLGPLLLMFGLKAANAASVSIWLNMELVATAVLGVLLFKDNIDKPTLIAVFLTLLAGLVTSAGEPASGIASALLVTGACFSWGIDNHLTALTDGSSPQTVTFLKGIIAGSVNLIIGVVFSTQTIEFNSIIFALIVGVFSYGLSIVLYVTSAQNMGATRSQILFSTAPLWGIVLTYLFIENSFQWTHIISIVLLALSIILINLISHSHAHMHIKSKHIHYHNHNDGHHDHNYNGKIGTQNKWHSHVHTHSSVVHKHPHYPDIHHRHDHGKTNKG